MSPLLVKDRPAPVSSRWFRPGPTRHDDAYLYSGQAGNSIQALSEEERLELMFESAEIYGD